jgi:hypothetical protein
MRIFAMLVAVLCVGSALNGMAAADPGQNRKDGYAAL